MNTDQGAQFTCEAFTGLLHDRGIRISMDGRGRWLDNIFIERFWRKVYLKAYETIPEAGVNLPPTSTSTTVGAGTKGSTTTPRMRSTGLHYRRNEQLPEERVIT